MFEEFSAGYYLGRLYVETHDGDRALMHRDQHERANRRVYATGDGIERLDSPLVMKLDDRHFPVHGAPTVPADTLAVPEPLVEPTRTDPLPALREVLLAKAEQAGQLLRWLEPGRGTEGPLWDGGPG